MSNYNRKSAKWQEMVLHFVLTPKYRRPFLTGEVALQLAHLIYDVCDELEVEVLALAIQPDHVHLMIVLPRQLQVARLMQLVKGRSSFKLRRQFPHLVEQAPKGLWGRDYFVRTVGGGRRAVKKYIAHQM